MNRYVIFLLFWDMLKHTKTHIVVSFVLKPIAITSTTRGFADHE